MRRRDSSSSLGRSARGTFLPDLLERSSLQLLKMKNLKFDEKWRRRMAPENILADQLVSIKSSTGKRRRTVWPVAEIKSCLTVSKSCPKGGTVVFRLKIRSRFSPKCQQTFGLLFKEILLPIFFKTVQSGHTVVSKQTLPLWNFAENFFISDQY